MFRKAERRILANWLTRQTAFSLYSFFVIELYELFEFFVSNYVPQGGTANFSELADAADRFFALFFFVIELYELFEFFFKLCSARRNSEF